METYRRIEGLVDYIAGKYHNTVEIGIGCFPDVASHLIERGVHVFATDIRPYYYNDIKVFVDDVKNPLFILYEDIDLVYSMRTPSELVPYMINLAKKIPADLIVKPLSSEYLGGQLVSYGNTTFFLWKYGSNNYDSNYPVIPATGGMTMRKGNLNEKE